MATTSSTPSTETASAEAEAEEAISVDRVTAPVGGAEPTAAPRVAGRPVSRTLAGAFAVLLVFLVLLGALGLVGTERVRSDYYDLTDRVGPGRLANTNVLQSLTNAQTGIRGYLLSGDRPLLAPYRSAAAGLPKQFATIESSFGGDATVRARVAAERTAAEAWLSGFAGPVARGVSVPDGVDERLFDGFRAANAAVGTATNHARDAARDSVTRTLLVTIVAIGACLVIGLAVSVRTAVVTTRRLVRPLARVRDAVGALARGRLQTRLSPEGPAEIFAVDTSVNTLAGELERSAAAAERAAADLAASNDKLQAANRELEAFSYSVSHDLRAPLRAVSGFSRILGEEYADQLPEEARGYLSRIRNGTLRMGELIDDLLTFAHIGRQSLHKQADVDPAAIVCSVWAEQADARAGRPIDLTVGALPACDADPALLALVYTNLLSNALKFTRGRDPARIEVGSRVEDGCVVYYVTDNGAGFDPRYTHKLFGVFQRLHRTEEFEGTGVGLALSARIVGRHGGRIWADGKPGEGATFSFTLNQAPSVNQAPARTEAVAK